MDVHCKRFITLLLLSIFLGVVNFLRVGYAETVSYPNISVIVNQEYFDESKVTPAFIKQLNCISSKLNFKYKLFSSSSWIYIQYLFKYNHYDIIANIDQSELRAQYSSFSKPISKSTYVFAFKHKNNRKDLSNNIMKLLLDKKYYVAVKVGSAEMYQLSKYGITNFINAENINEMVKLHNDGIVDGFVTELSRIKEFEKSNKLNFDKQYLFDINKGYYIHNSFINKYPNFLNDFNNALDECTIKY